MLSNSDNTTYAVCIIGAGAAGLFAAGRLAQAGIRTLLIDHSDKLGEKIRISGGGRCNFTNRNLDVRQPDQHFLGQNPRFCRSALSRFTPHDFIKMVEAHGIAYHEKHKGQLFCDNSAQDIIDMLLAQCQNAPAPTTLWQGCTVERVEHHSPDTGTPNSYTLHTSNGAVRCTHLVIATGGLSIPKIGATGWGYDIATQFGHSIVPTHPALVPFTCAGDAWQPFKPLSGLSIPVRITAPVPVPSNRKHKKHKKHKKQPTVTFDEDLLFTHKGLSGPASLQISSYWVQQPTQPLTINCLPQNSHADWLLEQKNNPQQRNRQLGTVISHHLPKRLAAAWQQHWLDNATITPAQWQESLGNLPDRLLRTLAGNLCQWQLHPNGTEGYRKAEVTVGGVNTSELSSKSMESKRQPHLYFIGEVVDITGWLGGYNFQWAWASAAACSAAIAATIAGVEDAPVENHLQNPFA